MCWSATQLYTCGHQAHYTHPCSRSSSNSSSSGSSGKNCTARNERLSHRQPCDACTQLLALATSRADALHAALMPVAEKLLLVLDECLMHTAITAAQVAAMAVVLPRIEEKVRAARERAERVARLLNGQRRCLRGYRAVVVGDGGVAVAAAAASACMGLEQTADAIEDELVEIAEEMRLEMAPLALRAMWEHAAQLDYCWFVVQRASVHGELQQRRRRHDLELGV